MDRVETKLTLKALCKRYPGHELTPQKIRVWLTHGCDGVRLNGTKAGHQWLVSPADLDAFFARLTSRSVEPEQAKRTGAPDAREQLRAMGVRV